jgi:transcriptional regulator with XRE-family HTH domain
MIGIDESRPSAITALYSIVPQITMATIGENIKRVRNKLGLTQDDLVRKSGVKHTTLTKIESNVVVKPSVHTVAKIVKALGVPMEELLK